MSVGWIDSENVKTTSLELLFKEADRMMYLIKKKKQESGSRGLSPRDRRRRALPRSPRLFSTSK
jgi:hypothetical protein